MKTQTRENLPSSIPAAPRLEAVRFSAGDVSPGHGLLRLLLSDDVELLRRAGSRVGLLAGKVLSGPEIMAGAVYFLESGLVGRSLSLADGRRLGLCLEGSGAVIGAEVCFEKLAAAEATVLVAGSGWRLSRAAFADIARTRPAVGLALARHFAERNAQLQTELACGVLHGIVPRLARALIRAFDLTASSALAITQEELAVTLRTQRTTISEAASHLKAQGAISHLRGVVRLIDRTRLLSISCGCGAGPD